MEFNFENIKILISEIEDGSMNKDNIEQNLPRFLEKNKLGDVAYCQQVHGKNIEIISENKFVPNADGLVTGEEIGLIIKSADCIPLLFWGKKGTIGAIHVGRRSLLAGIITDSLSAIFEKLLLSPTELKFFLAPHIRVNNYEIGKELEAEIEQAGYSPFIKENHFDLTAALISDLVKLGAKEENVIDSNIDNFSSEKLFSYRRGDRDKLFISLITKNQHPITK